MISFALRVISFNKPLDMRGTFSTTTHRAFCTFSGSDLSLPAYECCKEFPNWSGTRSSQRQILVFRNSMPPSLTCSYKCAVQKVIKHFTAGASSLGYPHLRRLSEGMPS